MKREREKQQGTAGIFGKTGGPARGNFLHVSLCFLLSLLLSFQGLAFGIPDQVFADERVQTVGEEEVAAKLEETARYLGKIVTCPEINSVGGEWTVLGLARGEFPAEDAESFFQKYIDNATKILKESKGILTTNKYTEYSRVILAWTALGKDPANAGGYDLLARLADFSQVKKQGLNGPVYALLALDSGAYSLPSSREKAGLSATAELTAREGILSYICSREAQGGGFSLGSGAPDPDVTAMVLQALAPYQQKKEIAPVVVRSLDWLSQAQAKSGAMTLAGEESSESTAQLVLALTSLGLDPEKDPRFRKTDEAGTTRGLVTALLGFANEDGSFRHLRAGSADLMATEQAFLALTGYQRFLTRKTPLFAMEDVAKKEEADTEASSSNTGSYRVLLNGKYLDFSQEPVNRNGRVLVPLRGIFEALGAKVTWDGITKTAQAELSGRQVKLTIGEEVGYVDGTPVALDASGLLLNGSTLVPLRFVAEGLAAQVTWDGEHKTAVIVKE